METKTQQRWMCFLCVVLISLFCLTGCVEKNMTEEPVLESEALDVTGKQISNSTAVPSENKDISPPKVQMAPAAPMVEWIHAERLSKHEIQLSWSDALDQEATEYIIKKRPAVNGAGIGHWSTVAKISSDGQATGRPTEAVDVLTDGGIHQFEYTVIPLLDGMENSPALAGTTVIANNLLVCIDPGHFEGDNKIQAADSYGYAEGDVTLRLAIALRDTLQETYGIASTLTREGGTISLGGYTNAILDCAHLTMRGTYAGETGSDLFLSIHTNANKEYANGYETCNQPVGINKPILIANIPASSSKSVIAVGNAIGQNLTAVDFSMGLSTVSDFCNGQPGLLAVWSDSYNDRLDVPGTIFSRLKENGTEDYYGVLRGAAREGVPGLIIEHGMHTVPQVRQAAMEGNLIQRWAEADAHGIAYGYGFITE